MSEAFRTTVRKLFRRNLALALALSGCELDAHLCLRSLEDGLVTRRRALGLYALHRTYNALRHGGLDAEDVEGAFGRYLREVQRDEGRREGSS